MSIIVAKVEEKHAPFIARCTHRFADELKPIVVAQYRKKCESEGVAAANVFLSCASELDKGDRKHVSHCTNALTGSIKRYVIKEYYSNYKKHGRIKANALLVKRCSGGSHKKSFSKPADKYAFDCQEAIRVFGVEGGKQCFQDQMLVPPKGDADNSTIARMVDADVWERKLSKRNKQRNEKSIRDAGHVYRDGQPYCSNWNVTGYIESVKDSQAYLKRQQAISSDGDELSLWDIAKATVANPANRKHEMMTRMKGVEEVAKSAGMMCLFVTLTASSKYHRKRFIKGYDSAGKRCKAQDYYIDNPNYQKMIAVKHKNGGLESVPNTPQLSHEFIKRIMGRSIAKFKRKHVDYMAYKVVEPNHDGTVHWHLAFFVQPEQKDLVRTIFNHYALREEGDEKGAKKYRIVIKDHDPKQGSVTGYMAKYIAKGIDGEQVGEDLEAGMDGHDSIVRILAWKSLWNIRQFAFYGSPSVTVWRELRRLRAPLANEIIEKARLAADEGNWADFVNLMKVHPIKLLKSALVDSEGHEKKNKYGEAVKRVLGLQVSGLSGLEVIRTRFKEWFLVDLDKLERRIIRGLPFESRDDETCLSQIKALVLQAKEAGKVGRLHEATRGVVPERHQFFSPLLGAGCI